MRKRMWGAIAGVAAGAGGAWGQSPTADPPPPAAVAPAGTVMQVQDFGPVPPGVGLPPGFGAAPGHPGLPPAIMPPVAPGPAGDPQGFGPMAGFGPPPGPMYPNPGPYGAPLFQPAPGGHGGGQGGGHGGAGAGGVPGFWMTYEYLMWYSKTDGYAFPLLTTSAPTDFGLLNRPSTIVLAGGGMDTSVGPLSGGRITAGFFADCDRRFGFEASGFVTEQRANIVDVATSPSGIPLLARPFRDSASPNAISTLVVGSPSIGQGQAVVFNGTQAFSVEANGVVNLYRSEPGCAKSCSLDFIAGYRYLELNEVFRETSVTTLNLGPTVVPITTVGPFGQVTVTGSTLVPGALNVGGIAVASGSRITIVDEIKTRNQFNGVQSGFRGEVRNGMFSFGMSGKLAIGHMRETLEVTGFTEIDPRVRAASRTFGGLYGNAATIGRFNNDEFAVVPEVNLNLGMAVTRNMTLHLGYNFLYVDKVTRPGGNLTTVVNTGTVPFSPNYGATNRPLVTPVIFNQDDFWLQGLTTGFTIRF